MSDQQEETTEQHDVNMVPIRPLEVLTTTEVVHTDNGPLIQQTFSTPAGVTFAFHKPPIGLQVAAHLIEAAIGCAPDQIDDIEQSIRDLFGVIRRDLRGGLETPPPAEIILPPGASTNGRKT